MNEGKFIDEILREFSRLLPPGLGDIQKELEQNLREVIQRSFDRMGLVTREEFDVQREVLARTRAKLETLEKLVAELEMKYRQ